MTILVTCPSCRHAAQIPRDAAGKTVRCTGCRAPFAVPTGSGDLTIEWGPIGTGRRLPIAPGRTVTIGRTRDNVVSLPGPLISRRHAALEWKDGEWRLRDLGSTNGTLVGGQRIREIGLTDGSRFIIGDFALRLSVATTGPSDMETALDAMALDESQADTLAVVGPADAHLMLADSRVDTVMGQAGMTAAEELPAEPRLRRPRLLERWPVVIALLALLVVLIVLLVVWLT